jgi:hypothetical protein
LWMHMSATQMTHVCIPNKVWSCTVPVQSWS